MLQGKDLPLDEQIALLTRIVSMNQDMMTVLKVIEQYDGFWIAGGAVCQTVWNHQNGDDLMHEISDFDVVYYDSSVPESEDMRLHHKVQVQCKHVDVWVDVKNQAYAHVIHERLHHDTMEPYDSLANAISHYPSVCGCIAVRLVDGMLKVMAPHGLNDMFGQVLRMNPLRGDEKVFDSKAVKWTEKWPALTVM